MQLAGHAEQIQAALSDSISHSRLTALAVEMASSVRSRSPVWVAALRTVLFELLLRRFALASPSVCPCLVCQKLHTELRYRSVPTEAHLHRSVFLAEVESLETLEL
jgi:hypothetical protein